ncbi:K(+)-transporting ATPase subunit F [Actinoalloteichus hymeniacidonis]|nr:K(+)-transporting ATPase subunit F [Actinoalloteichus hymeniacidonis]MBB5906663.1 K+-transporting ATPase KdpF subunit [Actinoalloteichus hymeniacidonis]
MTGPATSLAADVVAGVLALSLIGYLVFALLRPDRF